MINSTFTFITGHCWKVPGAAHKVPLTVAIVEAETNELLIPQPFKAQCSRDLSHRTLFVCKLPVTPHSISLCTGSSQKVARDPVSITFGRLMIIPSIEVIVRVFLY